MNNQRKRLYLCVALVLLLALVLPMFGCAKEEAKTTTAEEAMNQEKDNAGPAGSKEPPKVTQSDRNASSLESTPNKGGSYRVTSANETAKSAYTLAQELLAANLANQSATQATTLQDRRDLAEAYMRALLTIRWTVDEDVVWGTGSTTPYTYYAGRTYRGIPYSNGPSSLEAFLLYAKKVDDNGVAHMGITTSHLSAGWSSCRLGADYIDALVLAWHTVSSSSFAQSCGDIIPVNGYFPVGNYEIPPMTDEEAKAMVHLAATDAKGNIGAGTPDPAKGQVLTIIADGSLAGDTPRICQYNGEQVMYAAYAQLQKADGLVRAASDNAGMMLVSSNIVRKDDGTIDGEKSTLTVLQQHSENVVKGVEENGEYIIGYVDRVVTLKYLYDMSFIPVTVRELMSGTPNQVDAKYFRDSVHTSRQDSTRVYTGTVTVSRRPMWTNMVITDASGNVLSDSITLPRQDCVDIGTNRRFNVRIDLIDDAPDTELGLGDKPVVIANLAKGDYHCRVDVYLITGEVVTVRDFDFTI